MMIWQIKFQTLKWSTGHLRNVWIWQNTFITFFILFWGDSVHLMKEVCGHGLQCFTSRLFALKNLESTSQEFGSDGFRIPMITRDITGTSFPGQ